MGVSFQAAESYDRFMGRWSRPLAAELVRLVDPQQGQRVLDVGCGPGSLTGALVSRLGVAGVVAIDPAAPFVAAARERFAGVEVHQGWAESLPFDDDSFDLALAQLVVHFMTDPVAGLREMARVTRPGGVVATSLWDHDTGPGPLTPFWAAARQLSPAAQEAPGPTATRDRLLDLAGRAGWRDVEHTVLSVHVAFGSFDDWWEPFTLGVGPMGDRLAALDDEGRERLRRACQEQLPAGGPFECEARAWCVTGRIPA